jgi:hypothetical protein
MRTGSGSGPHPTVASLAARCPLPDFRGAGPDQRTAPSTRLIVPLHQAAGDPRRISRRQGRLRSFLVDRRVVHGPLLLHQGLNVRLRQTTGAVPDAA